MTSFLTVLLFVVLLCSCYFVAKYNRNDNLFLLLIIALLAGMAGGAIYNKLSDENAAEKKTNLTQVYNPTQDLPANSIDFYAVLGDASALEPSPVSKDIEIPAFGSLVSYCPSESFGEIRGQPPGNFNPRNKGTPGMPFDTS